MKVLFVNPAAGLGGAERALGDLIEGTLRAAPGVRVRLLALGQGPLVERVRACGGSAIVLEAPEIVATFGDTRYVGAGPLRTWAGVSGGAKAVPAALRFGMRVREEARAFGPDVVHSNGVKTHVLSALLSDVAPVVWHLRDFVGARPLAARLLRPLSRTASVGLAISRAVLLDARRALPALPMRLVGDATDTEAFCPGPPRVEALDALSSQPVANGPVLRIGLVGTYARWKGHDVFLRAAASLVRTRPRGAFRFYVVGGPIYSTAGSQFSQGELADLAHRLGVGDRVAFVPFQRDLVPVYRSLDVVVHASTRPEPFGLTITEAMACGRPVVVSAAGGAAEIVTPGRDGLTHAMGDAEGLAKALGELAADPALRASLGEEARRTATARFSRPRLISEMLEIFEELARSGRPRWSARRPVSALDAPGAVR